MFLSELCVLLEGACSGQVSLVYIDEAHIHWDTHLGYGWAPISERLYSSSDSPGLSAKRTFYGVYFYNEGQVSIIDYDKGNQENTIDVLKKIRSLLPNDNIKVIWDGVSYHRARAVYSAAHSLGIEIVQLPAYSPDFMPVEALWQWLRTEVTKNYCHSSEKDLLDRVNSFEYTINKNPNEVADRLWRTTSLVEAEEKLRISN
jgi:transposase